MRLPFHDPKPRGWQPDEPPSLSGVDTVYLDAETTGLQWWKGDRPVGWAVRFGDQTRYLPFGHRGGGNLCEERIREWARRELRGKHIVNLNTKFDALMMRGWGVDLDEQGNTFHDVAHSAALLDDHRRTFTLEDLSITELGTGKLDVGPKDDIASLPSWQVAAYAMRDVDLVAALHEAYRPRLAAEDLGQVQDLENAVIPAVVEMEFNGTPIDEALLHQWAETIPRLREQYLWEAWRKIGFPVNPDKADDLKRLFAKYGLTHDKKTETGAQSFDAEVMRWAAKQVPEIALIERASKLGDLDSKFIQPYLKLVYNGHIYGTFHQLKTGDGGTVSGRFSMVRPNLQQVLGEHKAKELYGTFTDLKTGEPHFFNVRDLFREETGFWFCADQAQVEFRVFGHYAKSRRIIETYRKPHAEREVDGKMVAYQGPKADFHIVVMDMIRTKIPTFKRRPTKDVNFARVYGAGLKKTAAMLGLPEREAAEIVALYDAEFPEARTLLKNAMSTAERRGYVKTILGRRSRFPGGQRCHKSLNAICQGTAADLNKRAMVEVHKERKRLGLLPRMTVHDEWNGRLEDKAMAPRVLEILNTQFIPLSVPILWDGGIPVGRQSWAAAK